MNFNKELWNKARERVKTQPENFDWDTSWCGTRGCIAGHICDASGTSWQMVCADSAIRLGFEDHPEMYSNYVSSIFFGHKNAGGDLVKDPNDNIAAVQAMDAFYARWRHVIEA